MIERFNEFNEFDVSCDYCPYAETYNTDDWEELMQRMRDDGWRSIKDREGWTHKCPACAEDFYAGG